MPFPDETNKVLFCSTSYRPTVPLDFVSQQLAFACREDCVEFLTETKITLTSDGEKIDCKASQSAFA